jgi:hypothetical protein
VGWLAVAALPLDPAQVDVLLPPAWASLVAALPPSLVVAPLPRLAMFSPDTSRTCAARIFSRREDRHSCVGAALTGVNDRSPELAPVVLVRDSYAMAGCQAPIGIWST